MLPIWKEAVEFALTLQDKPAGKYISENIPAEDLFVLVQEGETNPADGAKLEAHRNYVDIQIMLEGGETLYYSDIDQLTVADPYVPDAIFYQHAGQPIRIEPGMFFAAFPQDAHLACTHLDGPGHYKKLVVKIRL